MIRTYDEMQQVMRRIKQIVHKYIPDAEVKIAPSVKFYAITSIPPFRNKKSEKVIMEFSRRLVESGTWEQIEDTVAHEIAHVLAADRDDKSVANYNRHTEEWADIARALGSDITMPPFPNVEKPQRYKYRCADCGYTTSAFKGRRRTSATSYGEILVLSPGIDRHREETGHHKWHVLDEVTGRRWTEIL
jgi:hypothetical protein